MTITIDNARKLGKRTRAKGIVVLEFTNSNSYIAASYGDSQRHYRLRGEWLEDFGDDMESGRIKPPWNAA